MLLDVPSISRRQFADHARLCSEFIEGLWCGEGGCNDSRPAFGFINQKTLVLPESVIYAHGGEQYAKGSYSRIDGGYPLCYFLYWL